MSIVIAGSGHGKLPHAPGIFRIHSPKVPEYRFEWHEGVKKVYAIAVNPSGQEIADPIAEAVPDHGAAQMAVLIWLRGYQTGRATTVLKH